MTFPSPCLGCVDRHVGCHSTCQKYLEAKEQHEKNIEEAIKQEKARVIVECYRSKKAAKSKMIRLKQYNKRR